MSRYNAPKKDQEFAIGRWIAYWDWDDEGWMVDENTYLSDLDEPTKCDPYIYNH